MCNGLTFYQLGPVPQTTFLPCSQEVVLERPGIRKGDVIRFLVALCLRYFYRCMSPRIQCPVIVLSGFFVSSVVTDDIFLSLILGHSCLEITMSSLAIQEAFAIPTADLSIFFFTFHGAMWAELSPSSTLRFEPSFHYSKYSRLKNTAYVRESKRLWWIEDTCAYSYLLLKWEYCSHLLRSLASIKFCLRSESYTSSWSHVFP